MWQRYNGTTKIFEKSTDSGGSWLPLDLDAAIITQGAFAKARQHAQTAYLDAANVFSLAGNQFQEIIRTDKGIKFPAAQVASADANTLDDYEEVAWTPTLVSTGGGVPTYNSQLGVAVKVGKFVSFNAQIILTALGTLAAGNMSIQGLPYAVGATYQGGLFTSFWSGLTNPFCYIAGVGQPGTSRFDLTGAPSAGTAVPNVTKADLGAATFLVVHGSYIAGS